MENTISDSERARLNRVIQGVTFAFMGAPVVADVDRIVTAVQIADGGQTIAAQPDCPRNLTGTLTDADDSVSAVVTMKGRDPNGRPVQEVMTIVTGVGKTFVGTKIFAVVDSVVVSGTSGSGVGDDLEIGVGDVIGLPNDISEEEEVLYTYFDGALVTPDAVAVGESTSGIDCNSGTYDGAKLMYAIVQTAAQL